MNTHEYQAKEVLQGYGIPIPKFAVASTVEEIHQGIKSLGQNKLVIKAQVHAGGRGKAGGVKLATSPEEALILAKGMLGMKLVTKQTGKEGVIAHQVMLSEAVDIAKEYYIGCVIDRATAQPILIVSPEGGVEIEEVAERSPEKILTLPIALSGHLRAYQLWRVVKFMGWKGALAKQGMKMVAALAKAFIETDASLLEINPLVVTAQGELLTLDAKLAIDDNALFRQPVLAKYYDPTQMRAAEVEANLHDLAYIALDGEIGCMVNGAGLAMATMDIIKLYGKEPANFLDVGGGATKEKVAAGFKIILSDPNVKAILVNIFGGIMNCTTIAEGIIAAAKELDIHVPLVVRMEGTHVEKGRLLLEESDVKIIPAKDLADAALKVTEGLK
ncbi:MAG: ADP-forming succinate--CoA ligase subunit beta [Verrucomicrobia bacterium]|nr:ADP-forming succinate--CoA ligase subunit beta [Verrucomicrobiota bacterium]